ncbi:hypothetical protein BKA70DRAFT_1443189 [Coprinopsis sp. MPI-PUGE-AT-0042]|nr:hypothetical protein BKA70DRAFT_1443189 [Coprinopsis sp. MPI-PUGE-AT-0042]
MSDRVDKNAVANKLAEMADNLDNNTKAKKVKAKKLSEKKRQRIRATLATKSKMLLGEMYASVDRADRRTSLENIMVLAHDVRWLGLQIADEWPHIEEYAPHIGLLWRKLHESEETMKWATVPPRDDAVFDPSFLRELPVRGSQDVQGADGGVDMHAEDPFKAQDSHRGRIGVGAGDLGGDGQQQKNRRVYTMRGRLGQAARTSNASSEGPRGKDTRAKDGRQRSGAVREDDESLRSAMIDGEFSGMYADELLFALQDTGEVDDWEDVNDNEEPHGRVGGEKRIWVEKEVKQQRDVAEVGAKGKRKRPEGPSPKKDRKRVRTRDAADEEEDEDDDDDDDDGEEDSYPPSKKRCQNCVRKGALCLARPRGTCTACHDRKVKCTNTLPKDLRARVKVGTKGRNRGHQGLLATRSAIEPSAKQSTSTTDRQKTTRLIKSNAGETRAARMPTVTPKGRMIRDGNTIPTSEDDGDAGEGDGRQGGIPDGGVSRPSRTTRRNVKGKANEDAMSVDVAEDGEGAGIPAGASTRTTTRGRKTQDGKAKGTEVDVAEDVPPSDATLRIYGMTGELMGEYRQDNQGHNHGSQTSVGHQEVHPPNAGDADIAVLRQAIMQLQADVLRVDAKLETLLLMGGTGGKADQFIRRGEFEETASAIRNTFTTELASTKDKVLEMVKQHEKATLAKVETRAKKSAEVLEQELQEALKKVEETKEMLDAERATISVKAREEASHYIEEHLIDAISDALREEVFEAYRIRFDRVEELQTELQTLAERQEVSRVKSRQEDYGEIHNIAQKVFRDVWGERVEQLVEVTTTMSIKSLVGDHLDGMARSIKRMETEVKVLIDDSVKGAISSNLGDIVDSSMSEAFKKLLTLNHITNPGDGHAPTHSIYPLAAMYQNMAQALQSEENHPPFGENAEADQTAALTSGAGTYPRSETPNLGISKRKNIPWAPTKPQNEKEAERCDADDEDTGGGDQGPMDDDPPDEQGDHGDGDVSERGSQAMEEVAEGKSVQEDVAFATSDGEDEGSAIPTELVNLASVSTGARGRAKRNTVEPRERLPRNAKSNAVTAKRGRGRGRGS